LLPKFLDLEIIELDLLVLLLKFDAKYLKLMLQLFELVIKLLRLCFELFLALLLLLVNRLKFFF
jgi:hypothetical protein